MGRGRLGENGGGGGGQWVKVCCKNFQIKGGGGEKRWGEGTNIEKGGKPEGGPVKHLESQLGLENRQLRKMVR